MRKTVIISAAGWKGSGIEAGLSGCPEPFLPLGDGTTTLSRAATTFNQLGFDICIAVGQRGYPYKGYWAWRHPAPETIESYGDDSPWTQERLDYAAQFGKVVEIATPGWASCNDTFCTAMDHLGKHNWGQLVLAQGDILMSEGYLERIVNLSWPCQYLLAPNHSYLLLDMRGATFYRSYVEPIRRWKSWQDWSEKQLVHPSGHPDGVCALVKGGIAAYGTHDGPKGTWWDIDTPKRYAEALKMIARGTFTQRELGVDKTISKDKEWPEVVIVLLTWAGPPERKIAQVRLDYTRRAVQRLKTYLQYPNLSWHIADDGSPKEYQEEVKALLNEEGYTFSDTKKGWDLNNNWNRGAKVAFDRADMMVLWPDDRFLNRDLDLKPFVRLLLNHEDICDIRLRPPPPEMSMTPIERVEQKWWLIDKEKSLNHDATSFFSMKHKRYLDCYGYLPAGRQPTAPCSYILNAVFKSRSGPSTVVPDAIRRGTEIPWGTQSNWPAGRSIEASYGENIPWSDTNKLVIVGPTKLRGTVTVGGAKNSALSILSASLLTQEPVQLSRIPDLVDVRTLIDVMQELGATVDVNGGSVVVRASRLSSSVNQGNRIRYILLMLSVLLARTREVTIPLPGGCDVGTRKYDMHLDGLRAMGAEVKVGVDKIYAMAPNGLKGAEVSFYYPTFSGTMNIMIAAASIDDVTTINNPATDPEIVSLASFLHKMGVQFHGVGTKKMIIRGKKELGGCSHVIMADRIETATFITAGAITQGDIIVKGQCLSYLREEVNKLRKAGVLIEQTEEGIHVIGPKRPKAVSIATAPYPGFHTDCQPLFSTLMGLADGQSTVKETFIENRFAHLKELAKMGAEIEIQEGDFVCPNGKRGQVATIDGIKELHGAEVYCHDLRASAALLLAGLAANGETVLNNADIIDRGYERIDTKLLDLGTYASRQ